MMENNRDSKFLAGFIWGAIIGAGIVFLFGTKKGKKLLKTISEEGVGNLSGLLDKAGEEEIDECDNQEQKQERIEPSKDGIKEENKKPLVRRFFRRSSK